MTNVADEADGRVISDVIRIHQKHLRSCVEEVDPLKEEETSKRLLEQEADQLCSAIRYERLAERVATRAVHFTPKLLTQPREVKLRVPRLRSVPFEKQIIEPYKRRESSLEERLSEIHLAGVWAARRSKSRTSALGWARRGGVLARGWLAEGRGHASTATPSPRLRSGRRRRWRRCSR